MIGHTTCIWKTARGPILRVWVHFEPNRSEKKPYSIEIPIGTTCSIPIKPKCLIAISSILVEPYRALTFP